MAARLKRILITAGPTREMLDPVRFLTNHSTGEMGYAIAKAAVSRGYQVSLVSGPTDIQPPEGAKFYPVISALEMKKICAELFPKHDALIMTAAVCDFMPAGITKHKIPSAGGLMLKLKRTPDILASLAKQKGRRIVIGFCLETRDLLRRAMEKLIKKKLNGIVANFFSSEIVPFGKRRVSVQLIGSDGKVQRLAERSKDQIAGTLLRWMERLSEDQAGRS